MNAKNSYLFGIGASLLCSFLWGTTYVCGRYLIGGGKIDPLSLCLIRFTAGGIILFLIACIVSRKKIFSFSGRDMFKLSGLSMIGIFGSSLFIFMGQKYSSAINAAMIMNLSPLITMFICFFYGEKIRFLQIAGTVLGLTGCMMVVNVITLEGFRYSPSGFLGDLLLLVASGLWAVYVVYSKPIVMRYGGLPTTAWALLFGAVQTMLVFPFFLGSVVLPVSPLDWGVTLYFILFPTAIGYWAWYEGVARIEIALANVMQYLSPIFTILLSMLFLGETISITNMAGACMIIAGVAATGIKWSILKHIFDRLNVFFKVSPAISKEII